MLPIALHYLGRDPNSHNDADWQAAAELMKKPARPSPASARPAISTNWPMARSVWRWAGGDLNIAKRRAEEAKAGQEIKVLAPIGRRDDVDGQHGYPQRRAKRR